MIASGITSLKQLGYTDYFESKRIASGYAGYEIARVISEHREAYTVQNTHGTFFAKITGRHLHAATKRDDFPAVGDWVAIEELKNRTAVIRGILNRISTLKKQFSNKQEYQIVATNIDTLFITESMDRDYNLHRLDRFLVLAHEADITPIIVLNKTDLIPDSELTTRLQAISLRFPGIPAIPTSVKTINGTQSLESQIHYGKTYCFLGSSGVGKSSLINALLGSDQIKTQSISESIERGKHTTTSRDMHVLKNGGLLIDTPGTREVGIADAESGLDSVFDDVFRLSRECRFSDCTHSVEPGCVVLRAIRDNLLDEDRYENYRKMKKESDFFALTKVEKRKKDRQFGKHIKKVLKELKS